MRIANGLLLRVVLSASMLMGSLGPRLALCLGNDGHRAIESLDAGCCRPGTSGSAGMATPCAPTCKDIPLGSFGVRAPQRGGLTIGLSATALQGDIARTMRPTWGLAYLTTAPAPSPDLTQHLRSTILRC